ncbi:MAG: hypothetical protein ACYTEQ_29660, partial [Planctomycetota bacterium]
MTSLTPVSSTIVDDAAWNRHCRIVDLHRSAEKIFLELGAELYEFIRLRQYRKMDHPTIESYIADPDVQIGRTTLFNAVGIHERYVLELGCSSDELLNIGVGRLAMLRPYINEVNRDAVLAIGAANSKSDIPGALLENLGITMKRAKKQDRLTYHCPACGYSWVEGEMGNDPK